ncbi:MAG: 2Fe-2S iron-sulfur cluster binding domain-containing protein [Pigmentiphaga sp.]
MHQITAIFEDGLTLRFPCRPSEVVYQAARRASVDLSHDCLEGACGECKAFCSAGSFSIDDYSDEALSDEERAQGYALLCKMQASSDCVVELPYPSHFLGMPEQAVQTAELLALDRVSSSVVRTHWRLAGGGAAFLPGQYAQIEVPGGTEQRAYSYANAPGSETLEFYHKLLPDGLMSQYLLTRAAVGDEARIHPPAGHFYLRPVTSPLLMVAGGTGLAPMLSMLRVLAAAPDLARAPITLLLGVNQADEFFAEAELQALSEALPLQVRRAAVSDQGWSGFSGFATDLIDGELARGIEAAYLCGPPPMIEAGSEKLLSLGMSRSAIHSEKFLPSIV